MSSGSLNCFSSSVAEEVRETAAAWETAFCTSWPFLHIADYLIGKTMEQQYAKLKKEMVVSMDPFWEDRSDAHSEYSDVFFTLPEPIYRTEIAPKTDLLFWAILF